MKALIVFEDLHKGPVPALPKGATCELHLFEDIVELGQASKVKKINILVRLSPQILFVMIFLSPFRFK